MNKIFIILMLAVLAGSAVCAEDVKIIKPAAKKVMPLLRDGFAFPISGVEGLIIKARGQQKWFFSPYADISDMRSTVKAGTSVELLPSSTLEKIIGMMAKAPKKSSTMEIKLWGRVTKYSNMCSSRKLYYSEEENNSEVFTRNYIFPMNFIPITTVKENVTAAKPGKNESAKPDDPKSIIPQEAKDLLQPSEKKPVEAAPDDLKSDSIIPKEIMEKFKLKRVENLSKWKKNIIVMKDASLTNRTGFITQGDGYKIFTIDAMGRKVDDTAFKLLPCETLQRAEKDIVTSPGRNRYKVSGTITMFKGQYYMLLQRTVKTYNHGNFAR
ncbi:MAG: hypothetical protein FVQ82_12475 [Planctomycetes bacterium]|nr:hypothetical protein [Planctomycetota bacterium]